MPAFTTHATAAPPATLGDSSVIDWIIIIGSQFAPPIVYFPEVLIRVVGSGGPAIDEEGQELWWVEGLPGGLQMVTMRMWLIDP